MGCHTQFRGLRPNRPFGSAVAAALSIEYVISAQWQVARRSHRPPIPPTIPMSQGVLPPRPSLKSAGLFRPAVEPSMPFDFQQLANFRLARGSHKQPNKGGNICVNEAAVIAAGFQYREIRDVSFLPDCFSRPVSEYAIYLNDFMMHRLRNELLVPFITRLPGRSDALGQGGARPAHRRRNRSPYRRGRV